MGTSGLNRPTLMQSAESVQKGSSLVKFTQVRPAKVVSLEMPSVRVQQQV